VLLLALSFFLPVLTVTCLFLRYGTAVPPPARAASSLTGFPSAQKLPMRTYQIKAHKLDFEALNSYPQCIVNTVSEHPPYDVVVSVWEPADDELRMQQIETKVFTKELSEYEYPQDVVPYLQQTNKIESLSTEIRQLAESIAPQEKDIIKIVKETLNWTKTNIQYDPGLAKKISDGESDTQSALETLKRKQGTCSEYTNVFIAVMRSKDIPAKFIVGCNALMSGGYHAWAEFYLEGIGWVPVDPQYGLFPGSAQMIKLFWGKDFTDCGVLLKEISCSIEMPLYMGPAVACIVHVLKDPRSAVFIVPSHETDKNVQVKIRELAAQYRENNSFFKEAQIIDDEAALKAELSDKTLFIFGTPEGNRWLSKYLDRSSVRIAKHEIIVGKSSFSGRRLRLILTWPNPLNPAKGTVIFTAQRAEDVIGILQVKREDRDYVIAEGKKILKSGNCYKQNGLWSF